MFRGLINDAKSAAGSLIAKYLARASVAVPFVVALGGLPLLAPAAIAHWVGHLQWVQMIATTGAIQLPTFVLVFAMAAVLGAGPVLRLSVIPAFARRLLQRALTRLTLTELIGIAGALVAFWSCWHLVHVVQSYGAGWQLWSIVCAAIGVAAFPVYLMLGDRR